MKLLALSQFSDETDSLDWLEGSLKLLCLYTVYSISSPYPWNFVVQKQKFANFYLFNAVGS